MHSALTHELADKVKINRPGWYALRHKDGWWVGGEAGVTCYASRALAAYALTIAWRRDGGKQLNFKVDKYLELAKVPAGTYTPGIGAEDALKAYEAKAPK